jgi:hypothetical protein
MPSDRRYRIPVEQSHVAAWREVGQEGHGERTVASKRNTAGHIARRRTEKDGQKRVRQHEDEIPKPLPHAIVDVAAHFQRDAAQNQTPQDEKEREVITGKGGGQKLGEYCEHRAAEVDQQRQTAHEHGGDSFAAPIGVGFL